MAYSKLIPCICGGKAKKAQSPLMGDYIVCQKCGFAITEKTTKTKDVETLWSNREFPLNGDVIESEIINGDV